MGGIPPTGLGWRHMGTRPLGSGSPGWRVGGAGGPRSWLDLARPPTRASTRWFWGPRRDPVQGSPPVVGLPAQSLPRLGSGRLPERPGGLPASESPSRHRPPGRIPAHWPSQLGLRAWPVRGAPGASLASFLGAGESGAVRWDLGAGGSWRPSARAPCAPSARAGDELEQIRPSVYRNVAGQLHLSVQSEPVVTDAFLAVAGHIFSAGRHIQPRGPQGGAGWQWVRVGLQGMRSPEDPRSCPVLTVPLLGSPGAGSRPAQVVPALVSLWRC